MEGPPILWETAVFSPDEEWSAVFKRNLRTSEIIGRTGTWEEAEAMHARACTVIAAKLNATAGETTITPPPAVPIALPFTDTQ